MSDVIASSVEMAENAVLPRLHEVHADVDQPCKGEKDLPPGMQGPSTGKSAARWAYERLILYIKTFEDQLDDTHEVAMGFAGGEAGVIRIEGIGYFDPDLVTFYGADQDGMRTQLIQHVTRLSVMLRAVPKQADSEIPRRIGFRLERELSHPAAAAVAP